MLEVMIRLGTVVLGASAVGRAAAFWSTVLGYDPRVSWDYPTDPDFVVLSDTEGNLFCVVDASQG